MGPFWGGIMPYIGGIEAVDALLCLSLPSLALGGCEDLDSVVDGVVGD